MVRGAGKAQAQAKAQAKAAGQSQAKSQYGDRLKAMKMMCPVCKTGVQNYTTFTAHWESRHPKDPIPSQESLSGYVK